MMQTWPRSGGRVSGPGVPASIKTSPPPDRGEGKASETRRRGTPRPPKVATSPPSSSSSSPPSDRRSHCIDAKPHVRVTRCNAQGGEWAPPCLVFFSVPPAPRTDRRRESAEGAQRQRKAPTGGGGGFSPKSFRDRNRLHILDCVCWALVFVVHSFFFCFRPGFFGPRKQKKKQKKGTKACRKRDGPGPSSSDNGTIAIEGVSSRAARGGRRQAGSAGSAGKALRVAQRAGPRPRPAEPGPSLK